MSHYQKLMLLLYKINPEKLILTIAVIQIVLGDGPGSPPGGR